MFKLALYHLTKEGSDTMKRIFLLFVILIFALVGCGSKVDNVQDQEEKNESTTGEENTSEEEDENKTDENSSDVEITMPNEFFDGQTEDEVIAGFNEEGIKDVTVNDDGSYTIRMSKEEHEQLLNTMKQDIDADVNAIIESMGLTFIKEASMNDTVTELSVTIDQSIYDGDMEGLVLLDFALHAMPYQLLNGVTEESFNFEVVLIDSETGEEFERTSIHDE